MNGRFKTLPAAAVIVRQIPVVVRNISGDGCLVESADALREGTVGVLEVDVDGEPFSEVARICRMTSVAGSQTQCLAGAQFLPLLPVSSRSLRHLAGQVAHRDAAATGRGQAAVEFGSPGKTGEPEREG